MATDDEIHYGDIGTKFLVTITENGAALNISACTEKKLILNKPSGEALVVDAVFETDGSDGEIYYLSVANDLDEVGRWFIQAKIVMSGTWRSSVGEFVVYENLDEV